MENIYSKITNPELYKNGIEPYPTVQSLEEWLEKDISKVKKRGTRWLSEYFFSRNETRATKINNNVFYSPVDGVVMFAKDKVNATENIIEVKGCNYNLQDLFEDPNLQGDFLVVSIFLTFYNQHQTFAPYSGMRIYEELPSLSTYNKPMLAVEKDILNGVINPAAQEEYLKKNARQIDTYYNSRLQNEFYVCSIADLDVDCIVNYHQKDGLISTPTLQGKRVSYITYGSQAFLVIPLYPGGVKFKVRKECEVSNVVKAKISPIVDVCWGETYLPHEVEDVEN